MRNLARDYDRFLAHRPAGLETFSDPRLLDPTPCPPTILAGDVLHLHWVANFFDYTTFFASIPNDFPIIWTLHDMNPFTGGCHYAGRCEAFAGHCHSCPQLANPGPIDLSQRAFQIKSEALRDKNLHVVTPSHWLEQEARRSSMFRGARSIQTIPYGLDTQLFAPRDRQAARRTLQLPEDRVVIAFGAESLDNRRKGFQQLLTALSQLDTRQRIACLAFGSGAIPRHIQPLPEIRSVGYIGDSQLQSAIYSAADFFVMPSLEDNLPQTGIEAMACGLPVIAFDVGGVPDYVRPQETGLLAKTGDCAGLARQIDWFVERPYEIRRMGANARAMIVREFQDDTQAQRYAELYRRLLAQSHSSDGYRRAA
jgi:glycosyltransferase involved in cell wall biosynthesis